MTTRPSHQRQDDQAGELADRLGLLALDVHHLAPDCQVACALGEAATTIRALLDAPPCNSTDVVSHEGANLRDNGWQPIASAPHDVEVLLGWKSWVTGEWKNEVGCASSGWRRGGVSNMSRHGSATHWRELPAPPHVAPETNVERDGRAS